VKFCVDVSTGVGSVPGAAGSLGSTAGSTWKSITTEPGTILTIFTLDGSIFRNAVRLLMKAVGPLVAKNVLKSIWILAVT